MASVFEEDGNVMKGFDVFVGDVPPPAIARYGDRVEGGGTVLVRRTGDEELIAAALFDENGDLAHVAIRGTGVDAELRAVAVLDLVLRQRRESA